MRLQGKNILITGATSGIGKISAIKLAQQGAKIIFCGRDESKGNNLQEEINNNIGESKFIKCDVTNQKEVEHLISEAISYFGSIDCMFNNAGIDGDIATFAESTEQNWDQVLNTNLKGIWSSVANRRLSKSSKLQ